MGMCCRDLHLLQAFRLKECEFRYLAHKEFSSHRQLRMPLCQLRPRPADHMTTPSDRTIFSGIDIEELTLTT